MNEPCCCDYYQMYGIPREFELARHKYKVVIQEYVQDDTETYVYGLHSDAELTIWVALKVKDFDRDISLTACQVKNSFWHELFHAFNYFFDTGSDEALSQTFANFMLEFEMTKK